MTKTNAQAKEQFIMDMVGVAQVLIRVRFTKPTDTNISDTCIQVRDLFKATYCEMLLMQLELMRRYELV